MQNKGIRQVVGGAVVLMLLLLVFLPFVAQDSDRSASAIPTPPVPIEVDFGDDSEQIIAAREALEKLASTLEQPIQDHDDVVTQAPAQVQSVSSVTAASPSMPLASSLVAPLDAPLQLELINDPVVNPSQQSILQGRPKPLVDLSDADQLAEDQPNATVKPAAAKITKETGGDSVFSNEAETKVMAQTPTLRVEAVKPVRDARIEKSKPKQSTPTLVLKKQPPKPEPKPKPQQQWYIQIGSYGNSFDAQTLAGQIQNMGLPVVTGPSQIDGRAVTRVSIGPFAQEAHAVQSNRRMFSRLGVEGVVLDRN